MGANPGTGLFTGLVSAGIKGSTASAQKKEYKRILRDIGEFKPDVVSQEQWDNKKQAEINANNGLPSEQYNLAMRNIQKQQMQAIQGAQDRRSGGMLIPAIQANSNAANLALDSKNAGARLDNQRYLGNVNNQIANKKWQIYQGYLANFLRQQDYARKIQAAAIQNQNSAIESGVGGLTSLGGMMGGGSSGGGGGSMQSIGGSALGSLGGG